MPEKWQGIPAFSGIFSLYFMHFLSWSGAFGIVEKKCIILEGTVL